MSPGLPFWRKGPWMQQMAPDGFQPRQKVLNKHAVELEFANDLP